MLDKNFIKEEWEMRFKDEYHDFSTLEFKGQWWVPDNYENIIYGTLKIIRGADTYLNLMGSFRHENHDGKKHYDIILGLSSDGKRITLNRCFEKYYSTGEPGFPISIYEIGVVFIGENFNHQADINLRKIRIRYPYIDEWVNHKFYDSQFNRKKEFILKYNAPPLIKYSISDKFKVCIEFDIIRPPMLKIPRDPYMKHISFVSLEFKDDINFNEIMRIINHIQYLLSFAILRPIYPIIMQGIIQNKDRNGNMVIIFSEPKDIPKSFEDILHYDMFFTFDEISNKFGEILNNWIGKAEILESVYDLYFSTMYQPFMYLRHKFLNLMHALEIYHRNTKRNYELENSEHNKRLNKIIQNTPFEYKEWLKNKLIYSNEPSMRKRITELVENNNNILNEVIEERDEFIHKVISTRNYLTHFNAKLKDESAEGVELYKITQILKMLIDICLLNELGFEKTRVKELSLRNWEYKYKLQKI
jgi:hypothetical protein